MSVRWKCVGLWAVVVAAEIAALALGDLPEDAWAIPLIALLLTLLTGGRLCVVVGCLAVVVAELPCGS
jgi:hypothetical protein